MGTSPPVTFLPCSIINKTSTNKRTTSFTKSITRLENGSPAQSTSSQRDNRESPQYRVILTKFDK
ncbi:hypothetical protein K0M31_008372, partial [Melipona bicolor]